MEGRDVVAMARTGSGKTAAFLIPMFENLQTHSAKSGARALIMSPTRELALQTLKFAKEVDKSDSPLTTSVTPLGSALRDVVTITERLCQQHRVITSTVFPVNTDKSHKFAGYKFHVIAFEDIFILS